MTIKNTYLLRNSLLIYYMKTNQKDFLTLEEVRAKGLKYHVYTEDESVYKYRIVGKGETLVENGNKLCENVYLCWWREKGVYEYAIEGKGWTLIENGDKLCENVYECHWHAGGVYEYEIKGKGYTLKENDVILCENVYLCWWHEKGVYRYKQTRNSDWVEVGF